MRTSKKELGPKNFTVQLLVSFGLVPSSPFRLYLSVAYDTKRIGKRILIVIST